MSTALKVRKKRASSSIRKDAEKILEGKLECMPLKEFRKKATESELFGPFYIPDKLPAIDWYVPTLDKEAKAHAQAIKTMTRVEEVIAFKRYNFCRWKLIQLKKSIQSYSHKKAPAKLYREVLEWNARARHLQEYIFRMNLGLVLYLLKKAHDYLKDQDLHEVLSESEFALLRCIEKFNVTSGFKFSTYGCRGILRAFHRLVGKSMRKARIEGLHTSNEFFELYNAGIGDETTGSRNKEYCLETLQRILKDNAAELTDIERTVITLRFNLDHTQNPDSRMRLEDVGKMVGVTKERIRQIQTKAQGKIRKLLEKSLDGRLKL